MQCTVSSALLSIGRISHISASSAKYMIPLKMSLASVPDRNLVVFDELTNWIVLIISHSLPFRAARSS